MVNFIGDDIINSEDIIKAVEGLQQKSDEDGLSWEEAQLLTELTAVIEEASRSTDWEYGEVLINDSYIVDYIKDYARECNYIDNNGSWPLNHIDWDAAVDEFLSYYFSIKIKNEIYWIRS